MENHYGNVQREIDRIELSNLIMRCGYNIYRRGIRVYKSRESSTSHKHVKSSPRGASLLNERIVRLTRLAFTACPRPGWIRLVPPLSLNGLISLETFYVLQRLYSPISFFLHVSSDVRPSPCPYIGRTVRTLSITCLALPLLLIMTSSSQHSPSSLAL